MTPEPVVCEASVQILQVGVYRSCQLKLLHGRTIHFHHHHPSESDGPGPGRLRRPVVQRWRDLELVRQRARTLGGQVRDGVGQTLGIGRLSIALT